MLPVIAAALTNAGMEAAKGAGSMLLSKRKKDRKFGHVLEGAAQGALRGVQQTVTDPQAWSGMKNSQLKDNMPPPKRVGAGMVRQRLNDRRRLTMDRGM